MEYLQYVIVILAVSILTPLLLRLVINRSRKKENSFNKEAFVIQYGMSGILIVTLAAVMFTFLAVVISVGSESAILPNTLMILCAIFSWVALYLVIKQKVIVKGKEIEYTIGIGKPKKFRLKDIKCVKIISGADRQMVFHDIKGKKMFSISESMIGAGLFEEIINDMNIEIVYKEDEQREKRQEMFRKFRKLFKKKD